MIPSPGLLKIAIVSTWRSYCGLATYTRDLARALIEFGHHVVIMAEEGVAEPNDDNFDTPYIECWRRDITGYDALIRTVQDEHPDLIHLQHEYGLFQDANAFEALVTKLRAICPVVVTMHTVSGNDRGPGIEQDRKVAFGASAVIVHSWSALDALGKPIRRAIPVVHVPHGTPVGRKRMARGAARAQLGIADDTFVIASIGFISRDKRWEDTGLAVVKAMARASTGWIVGGRSTSDKFERLRAWIEGREVLCRRTVLFGRYLADDDLDVVYGAADVAVFNSGPTPYSTSGQLHLALAYGMPIVATRVSLYDEAEVCGRRFEGAVELASVLVELAADPDVLMKLADAASDVAKVTAWPRVAAMHDQIYRRALSNGAMNFAAEDDTGRVVDPDKVAMPIGVRPTVKVIV